MTTTTNGTCSCTATVGVAILGRAPEKVIPEQKSMFNRTSFMGRYIIPTLNLLPVALGRRPKAREPLIFYVS